MPSDGRRFSNKVQKKKNKTKDLEKNKARTTHPAEQKEGQGQKSSGQVK